MLNVRTVPAYRQHNPSYLALLVLRRHACRASPLAEPLFVVQCGDLLKPQPPPIIVTPIRVIPHTVVPVFMLPSENKWLHLSGQRLVVCVIRSWIVPSLTGRREGRQHRVD